MKANSKIMLMLMLWASAFFISGNAMADVKMPRIFSDNMVLQREVPVRVWGKADRNERVRVSIAGQTKTARADRNGNWMVTLDPLSAGGPHQLSINGKNSITYSNILIGDVWLGSGQSNMEWSVARSGNPQEEISNANFPKIRLFTVTRRISATPMDDLDTGEWLVCTPENIANFSAVAYYFGRHLHRELDVPIGIIHSSWGGTVAETWISRESIATHPDFAERIKETPVFDLERIQAQAQLRLEEWHTSIERDDQGMIQQWQNPDFNDSDWLLMTLPTLWESAGLPGIDGVVWFRREIVLTRQQAAKGLTLSLGPVDDSDFTYVNGNLVGKTLDIHNVTRRYDVPATYLKEGKNTIAVRVIDTGGGGGIWGDGSELNYTIDNAVYSLTGPWKYSIGINKQAPSASGTGPNIFPTLLFNGMINPVRSFTLRGIIWYQGESNAGRHYQYRTLFPLLINDWRKQFNNPQMPFLFVQLANFMQPDRTPVDSDWARLREAQTMTLSLPNTGMAVAIDIGEADDIHPLNKQDVGHRLSLAALRVSYGKDIVHSGPSFKGMKVEGSAIRLDFEHTGSGLVARDKYGYLKGFAIAGEDKVFRWAKARLDGNQVIVYNNDVKEPVAVRYAWGNNPDDANLFNAENLPAIPFRTDNW